MKELEEPGLKAVQLLRKSKLAQRHPFMINLNSLPEGQCYLEFPDGSIHLVVINKSKQDFEMIRQLSTIEGNLLRRALQLL